LIFDLLQNIVVRESMRKSKSNCILSGWLFLLIIIGACTVEKEKVTSQNVKDVPVFNADSSYYFIETQVGFGPRVPNTDGHRKAGEYLANQFKIYGASVTEQEFTVTTFDRQSLQLRNIIATYHPELTNRILLASHWDTRPFADKDPQNKNTRFEGANDGASGVGVLLEIARLLGQNDSLKIGVDIILFDGEDWGERDGEQDRVSLPSGLHSWWCLGSQYWSKNKHRKNYTARYGILLDMVGSNRAQFFREGSSMEFAPRIVDKVWTMAHRLGYSDYFIKQNVPAIIDDHVFVNQIARIPMIDIVHYQAGLGFFGDYHHTQKDNMSIINKETLKAVGTTVLNVIFYEEP